nr:MAG TPA: hypothetical protein [Caudoviricetes sp.]
MLIYNCKLPMAFSTINRYPSNRKKDRLRACPFLCS